MRGDQLARQWQLIQHLAKSHGGVGLDELADELGCVKRTIYRDLDALMYAGFPVMSEKRDGRVFYRFLDSFRLGDVPFTSDEVLALAFGEDLLRTLEGTVFHDSIRSALGKIRAGLGPDLSGFLERLTDAVRVIPGPHKRYAEQRDTIRMLNDAVLARRTLTMRYRTASTGAESERQLDPYRVWYRSGGLYVIGHDHQSDEIRTFAVDRILALVPTDSGFEIPDDFDFDARTGSAFGVISEPASRVRIHFAPRWRSHVEAHTWHESQRLDVRGDGGVELRMEVGGTAELCNWVLSFGSGAQVIEPESLRQAVARELREAALLYAG
jgi:predicted DNA-binding transcriptional regulator YafY